MLRKGPAMAWAKFDGHPFRVDNWELRGGAAESDVTEFGASDWREMLAGLEPVTVTVSGRWDGDDVPDRFVVPPNVPFRMFPGASRRYWRGFRLPLFELVEYRRDAGRVPIVRIVHRRWWWVSRWLAMWWLRRETGVKWDDVDGDE